VPREEKREEKKGRKIDYEDEDEDEDEDEKRRVEDEKTAGVDREGRGALGYRRNEGIAALH